MKFRVLSIAINTNSSPMSLVGPYTIDQPREEVIDTATNQLFDECDTPRDVELVYENFWNYPDDSGVAHEPSQKVKVLHVELISRVDMPKELKAEA